MIHSTITPEQQDISTVTDLGKNSISLKKSVLILLLTATVFFGIATWIGYKFFWYQPVYESVEDYQLKTALHNVQNFPGNAALRVELGWNYMRIGNFQQARKELKNALQLDGENFGAVINLAMIDAEEGNVKKAKERLEKLVSEKPTIPDARQALAQVYMESKDYDKAIEEFSFLLKLNPGTVDYIYMIGKALESKGNVAEAKEKYEQVLSYVPDYAEAEKSLKQLDGTEVKKN